MKMKAVIALSVLVVVVSAALQPLKPFQPLQQFQPLQRQQLQSFQQQQFQPLQRQQQFQSFQRQQQFQPLKPLQSLSRTQPSRPSQPSQQLTFQRPGVPFKIRYVTSNEDGQYQSDNSGAYYNEGGQYRHDESGTYVHDNSGEYVHQDEPYVHIDSPYEHQEIGGGEYVHPVYVEGIPPAGGYGPPVTLRRGNAAGLYDNRNYKIIRKIEHVGQDLYDYLYETENGIYAEEDGKIAYKGTDDEAIRAKGYFTYTGPDSIIYSVNYTADENGFLPEADHLPTPPPLPEAIARSLAYQRAIGELEDKR